MASHAYELCLSSTNCESKIENGKCFRFSIFIGRGGLIIRRLSPRTFGSSSPARYHCAKLADYAMVGTYRLI